MNETTKKCPMCAEEIQLEAAVCRYCGAQFEVTHNGYCQNCHQIREADGNGQCKICSNPVMDLHAQSRHIDGQPQTLVPGAKTLSVAAPKPKISRWVLGGILMAGLLALMGLCLVPVVLDLALPNNPFTQQATHTAIIPAPLLPNTAPSATLEGVPSPESPAQTVAIPAADGSGTATGRVMWNDQPMAGVTVKLCADWGMFGGCKSQEYSAVSGGDGYYTISGLPSGEYDFVTKTPGQENETGWLGFSVTIVDGQSATIRDANIIKYDLEVLSPDDDTTVPSDTITLTWKGYSGAAYYKVYVADAVMFEKVSATQYTFPTPLKPDKYYWVIYAYNSNGTEIAESDGQYFVVAP